MGHTAISFPESFILVPTGKVRVPIHNVPTDRSVRGTGQEDRSSGYENESHRSLESKRAQKDSGNEIGHTADDFRGSCAVFIEFEFKKR